MSRLKSSDAAAGSDAPAGVRVAVHIIVQATTMSMTTTSAGGGRNRHDCRRSESNRFEQPMELFLDGVTRFADPQA
jgi:hypothetical protein